MSERGLATDSEPASAASTNRWRRRWVWGSVAALTALFVSFVVLSAVYFVWPTTATPRRVDAVLNLNGASEGASSRLAVSLVKSGIAPVLIFSEGTDPPYCPQVAGIDVVCFLPRPARTVGEIDFAARYARAHDIHSILIVADQAQTTRAGLLAHRCFPGSSLVVNVRTPIAQLPKEVLYEWGATIKALLVDRGCN